MTIAYAIAGALIGLALVHLGVGVHIGQTFLNGPAAYAVSAVTGAAVLLVARYAVHKTLGLIIP